MHSAVVLKRAHLITVGANTLVVFDNEQGNATNDICKEKEERKKERKQEKIFRIVKRQDGVKFIYFFNFKNSQAVKNIKKSIQNAINPASTALYAAISPYPVVLSVAKDQYKL